ncbi:MAG: ABC transporter ATP-binding protein, partial [Caldisericaceae bacterium]|nr:ABC transporter ATP-binding protein [Caldisericaceae bacterium]
TLEIKEREYISIMGPSGSGKTTLLNVIGSLDIPTKGEVLFEEKDLVKMNDTDISQFRRKNVGFVFQMYNLISDLIAWENVSLPLYYDGVKDKSIRKERAVEVLKKVGLEDRVNHYPAELSGGEEQRVAIARALINHPRMILADEPTGNLDSKSSEGIMNLFEEIYEKENITLVVVTHERHIAERAEKIVHLLDGTVQQVEELKTFSKI